MFFEDHIYHSPREKNFVACYQTSDTRIPAQWILTEFSSPRGIIHRHLFGPFELLEDIEGPHGVSACGIFANLSPWTHGREMLLALWDEMKELLREANQKNKEKALAILNSACRRISDVEREQNRQNLKKLFARWEEEDAQEDVEEAFD